MRIAVMAAGAVGGYFGGRMAAAGHDVAFIARGAHRDAIRRDGLKIESALGDLHLKDVNVTDDPTHVGRRLCLASKSGWLVRHPWRRQSSARPMTCVRAHPMPNLASIRCGFYRIPLAVVLSDSTHSEMRAFELNTVRLTDAEGAEGVGYTYSHVEGRYGQHCWTEQFSDFALQDRVDSGAIPSCGVTVPRSRRAVRVTALTSTGGALKG